MTVLLSGRSYVGHHIETAAPDQTRGVTPWPECELTGSASLSAVREAHIGLKLEA